MGSLSISSEHSEAKFTSLIKLKKTDTNKSYQGKG